MLGDGHTCRFWTYHWLHGQSIAVIAPTLVAMVPRRRKRTRLVSDSLRNQGWISDIADTLGPLATLEYVELWHILRLVSLSTTPDTISRRWSSKGVYIASTCYTALFIGSTTAPFWKLIWRSWAPQRQVFSLASFSKPMLDC